MRRLAASCLVCGLLLATAQAQTVETRPPQAPPAPAQPRALANNDPNYLVLRSIRMGSETVRVKDFVLRRDAGTFTFKSGVFRFLEPVDGRITGAIFSGEASFDMRPPIAVEQRYLGILTRGQPFHEQFSSALFRFTDGSEAEIRKASTREPGAETADTDILGEVQQQLRKKLRDNLDARLLEDVLSSRQGGKFTAFLRGRNYSNKIIYDVDPEGVSGFRPEEVALLLWDDAHAGAWSVFHFSSEYAQGTANSDEQNYPFRIEHQKLDVSINKGANLGGIAETRIVALQDGVRVLALDLFPTLRVSSVSGEGNQQLAF